MKISDVQRVINISGSLSRLEQGPVRRNVKVEYQHVQTPVVVEQPQVDDLTNLVVVHDQIQIYR